MSEHAIDRPQLVRLRDGSRVTVRAATVGDEPALRTLLGGMRPETQRMRFFTGAVDVGSAARLASVTGEGRFAVVALIVVCLFRCDYNVVLGFNIVGEDEIAARLF